MTFAMLLMLSTALPAQEGAPPTGSADAEAWNEKVRRHLRTNTAPPAQAPFASAAPAADTLPTSLEWRAVDDGRQRLGVAVRPLAKARRAPRLGIEYRLALD